MAFPNCDSGAKVSSTSRGGKKIRREAVVVVGKEAHLTPALPGAINNPFTKERTGTASLSRAVVGYPVATLVYDSSRRIGQKESGKWTGVYLDKVQPLTLSPSRTQMGRPGLPEEKVSDAQLSGAPDAPGDAPDDDIHGIEDSDLMPSVTLGTALLLLFLLMSFWLAWPHCHTSYEEGS